MSQRTLETWHSSLTHDEQKAFNVKQRIVLHEHNDTDTVEIAYEFNKHDIIDHHDPLFVEKRVLSITPAIGIRDENDLRVPEGDVIVFDTWSESPYGNPSKIVEHRMQLRVVEHNSPDGVVVMIEHQRADPVREYEYGSWDTGEFHTVESTEVIVGEPHTQDPTSGVQSMSGAGPSAVPESTTVSGDVPTPLEEKFPPSLR